MRTERHPRRIGVAQGGNSDSVMHDGDSVTARNEKRTTQKVQREDVKLERKEIGRVSPMGVYSSDEAHRSRRI